MYYSQFKQDEFLHKNFFKDLKDGFFVDVGAHDGECGNNSLFFEKEMNWNGICIEPLSHIYDKMKKNRKSININCAVDEEDGETSFYQNSGYTEMLSGLVKHYDPRHQQRRDYENQTQGGKSDIVNVKTLRLETIFQLFGVLKSLQE